MTFFPLYNVSPYPSTMTYKDSRKSTFESIRLQIERLNLMRFMPKILKPRNLFIWYEAYGEYEHIFSLSKTRDQCSLHTLLNDFCWEARHARR